MDKNFLIEYYTLEREHWWFKARMEILRTHIQALNLSQPLKILNVGVASGATSLMLKEFGEVTSLEYDEHYVKYIRNSLPEFEIDHGSILSLPYKTESFDLVCAFDVLEHVQDDVLSVAELKRVCKPEKTITITVPYLMLLWSQHDAVNHHLRRYTRKQVKSLFKTEGNIIFLSFFNCWLFPLIAFFRIISNFLPDNFLRKNNQAGSDFSVHQPKWLEHLFFRIMRSEKFFIKNKISLPIGLSILLSFRKNRIN